MYVWELERERRNVQFTVVVIIVICFVRCCWLLANSLVIFLLLLAAKVAPALLSKSYGLLVTRHIHDNTSTSVRYQLPLSVAFAAFSRSSTSICSLTHTVKKNERKREYDVKETNRPLSPCLFLSLGSCETQGFALVFICVCVKVFGYLWVALSIRLTFPICLYCITAWQRPLFTLSTL